MSETKNLKDLEIMVTLRSSEADIKYLRILANVIVTSLQSSQNLDIAFIEIEETVKTKFGKRLCIISGTIAL